MHNHDVTGFPVTTSGPQHFHNIQVIAIYNEHKDKLENDLEEISTALTCIVSIKDYHEEMISQANFKDIPKGEYFKDIPRGEHFKDIPKGEHFKDILKGEYFKDIPMGVLQGHPQD